MVATLCLAIPPLLAATPFDPDLARAVQDVSCFDFRAAYPTFAAVMNAAPTGSPVWAQATYGTAVCAQHIMPATRQLITESESLYRLLLAHAPDSPYAPRALLNLGRIRELSDYYTDACDPAGARDCYRQVIQRWPALPIAGEATLRLAGTFIQTFDATQALLGVTILESWLAQHPRDELASAMWQYLGDTCFIPLGDYAKALACYRNADQLGLLLFTRAGQCYWRMAVLADRYLTNRAAAVEYYTKLITTAPSCGKACEAQAALKRLGAPVPETALFDAMKTAAPARANQPETP